MGNLIPIVAIIFGCTIPIVAIWSRHKQKLAAMERGILLDDKGKPIAAPQDNVVAQAEMNALRERVKVLERIVTDGGYDLANEIEQLRDAQPPSQQAGGTPLNLDTREQA